MGKVTFFFFYLDLREREKKESLEGLIYIVGLLC